MIVSLTHNIWYNFMHILTTIISECSMNVFRHILRGLRMKCPACGAGKIYDSYLKISPCCSQCKVNFAQFPCQDAPAYLTILIVGHIIVPVIYILDTHLSIPSLWLMVLGCIMTIIATLLVLPCTKGLVLACMWALRIRSKSD